MSKTELEIIDELKQHVTYVTEVSREALLKLTSSSPGSILVIPTEIPYTYDVLVNTGHATSRGVMSYDENTEIYSYLDESAQNGEMYGIQNGLRQYSSVAELVSDIRNQYSPSASPRSMSDSDNYGDPWMLPDPPSSPDSESGMSQGDENHGYVGFRTARATSIPRDDEYPSYSKLTKKEPENSFKTQMQQLKNKITGQNSEPQQILDKVKKLDAQLDNANKPKQLKEVLNSLDKLEKDLNKLPKNANPEWVEQARNEIDNVRNKCNNIQNIILRK